MSIKCIDNFLKPQVFKQIEDVFLSDHFSWFFNEYKVYGDKEYFDNFQMTHTLYKDGDEVSVIKGSDTVDQYKEQGWSEQKSAPKSRAKKSLDD